MQIQHIRKKGSLNNNVSSYENSSAWGSGAQLMHPCGRRTFFVPKWSRKLGVHLSWVGDCHVSMRPWHQKIFGKSWDATDTWVQLLLGEYEIFCKITDFVSEKCHLCKRAQLAQKWTNVSGMMTTRKMRGSKLSCCKLYLFILKTAPPSFQAH